VDIIIKPADLGGEVKAVASKSYAHRLLILSSLSDKKTVIKCSESSDDIDATINCLNSLGAKAERSCGGFTVTPIFNEIIKSSILDCGESGSTLRFLLPVACALGARSLFCGHGRLPQRPMAPLYEALTTHGCTLSAGGVIPFRCGGRLKGGRFTLPGNVSSQFISGLLLALPLLYEDSVIEITGDIESKDYIAMTLSALRLFGINIEFRGNNLYVNGGIKYISPGIVTVEGDWSNAAFWLCAGAIGKHGVKCTELDIFSSQGDKAIDEILTQFGAQVTVSDNSVTVSGSELYGTELDVKDIPDLVPALAVVASAAKGKTIIKNASRLRIKESDRLYAVTNALSALGADIAETGDGLIVTGQKRLKGGRTDSFGDHRIAMMASIASVVCDNPVIIENAGSVKKSYPDFFSDFTYLGGNIEKRA
jgi:3-phosphoshikimate 1-carboxyvinyltransferase